MGHCIERQVLIKGTNAKCPCAVVERELPMPRNKVQAKIDNDIICCNDVSNVSVTLLITKFSSLFDKAVVIVATLKALQALARVALERILFI